VHQEDTATPRKARFAPTGYTFHVVNRRNDRRQLFFEDTDYEAFLRLLARGKQRHEVKVFGLCVMPNHYHALVRPEADHALSAYLHWVQGCYACDLRSHTRTKGNGHVFQQRFWSGGIEDTHHFMTTLRYIEANPVAGKLVKHAQDWRWSSMTLRSLADDRLLDPLPIDLPANWFDLVNEEPLPGEGD